MAERDRLRAHHAHSIGERRELLEPVQHERRPRRLDREELDGVLGRTGQRLAVEERAAALDGRPLLVGAEVVDEAEDDVVHRLPALGHRDAEREVRNRPLGVLRAVDRVDDDRDRPVAADPDLLGDDPDVGPVEVLEHDPLGGLVERGGDVAALAEPDGPLALLPRGHRGEDGLHVGDGRPAQLEPGTHETGRRSRPEVSLG